MIKELEKLSKEDQDVLLKAPVIVSVLAAFGISEINKWEKADAIKLAHLKTYTAHPLLIPYYTEVDKSFEQDFETLAKQYVPFDDTKRALLQLEVDHVNKVINKLNKNFAHTLHASLLKYAEHVKNAYKGLVMNFIFPYPIPGLSE
ncbi:hypothetical protein WSM22_40650 [Cytophagales bacterium WSM2-2]|nr:hypothetical protein WSM22_40650 [Cytophagales bacterium WSM2-2]